MFNLDGASFDAPGAQIITKNPKFAELKAILAPESSGQIKEDFTNYRVNGSIISNVGTAVGNVQNIQTMNTIGVVGLASTILGVVGGAKGRVLSKLVTSVLGAAGFNVDSLHSMDGIEQTMHLAAGLEKALGKTVLKMDPMVLSWGK
jgi:hypothetical protein